MGFRLLLVSNLYPPEARGGAEWVAADLAEGLAGRGHEVRVLTSRPDDSSSRASRAGGPGRVEVRRLLRLHGPPPAAWPGRLHHLAAREYYDRANGSAVREEIRRFRPDLVYVNAPTGLSHGPLAVAGYSGLPVIVHLHDYWLRDLLLHAKLGIVNRLGFRFLLRRARFLAVSGRLRDLHVDAGIPAEHITVIHNGIRRPTEPASGANREGAIYCGRVTRNKGLHIAATASARAGFALDVLGGGDEEYLRECMALGEGRVRALGRVPRTEVPAVLSRYRVLLLPALWEEPCPLVVLEALAAGCVPIVSRRGGLPELVEGIDAVPSGAIVDSDDPGDWAGAVTALLGDEPRRARMASAGFEGLACHWSWERQLDEVEAACASSIGS